MGSNIRHAIVGGVSAAMLVLGIAAAAHASDYEGLQGHIDIPEIARGGNTPLKILPGLFDEFAGVEDIFGFGNPSLGGIIVPPEERQEGYGIPTLDLGGSGADPFGGTYSPFGSDGAVDVPVLNGVPTPGATGLLLIGVAALSARRRRN